MRAGIERVHFSFCKLCRPLLILRQVLFPSKRQERERERQMSPRGRSQSGREYRPQERPLEDDSNAIIPKPYGQRAWTQTDHARGRREVGQCKESHASGDESFMVADANLPSACMKAETAGGAAAGTRSRHGNICLGTRRLMWLAHHLNMNSSPWERWGHSSRCHL